MDITITYCTQWNYEPRAAGLADAIAKAVGHSPRLIPGSGGVFDVVADGRLIFSRKAEGGRFPEDAEVIAALRGGPARS